MSVGGLTPGGDEFAAPQPGAFWANITGNASGTNRYSWEQIDDGDTPTFAATLADGFGASGGTGTSASPAYEVNGRTDVATGTRVLLYPMGDLSYYGFAAPATSSGGISGSGTDNRVVRWNGTSAVQDSTATLSDAGDLTVTGGAAVNGSLTVGTTAVITVTVSALSGVISWFTDVANQDYSIIPHYGGTDEDLLVRVPDGSALLLAGTPVGAGTAVYAVLDNTATKRSGYTGTLAPGMDVVGGIVVSGGSGSFGTVTSVSGGTSAGVTVSVASGTTTPSISVSLGAITPSSVAATGDVTAAGGAADLTSSSGNGQLALLNFAGGTNVTLTAGTGNVLTASGGLTTGGALTVGGGGANITGTLTAADGSGVANLDAGNIASGTLAVARGGTGTGSTPTNGQLLIGNGTDYTLATLTAGSGISITNGAGSITIAATGGGGGVTSVAATAPAAGFTISGSPITSTGTFVFALSDDLAALEGMSGTGLVARTASNTYAQRTLTGPASGITVSNGNGVSGNPTLALANDLAALEALTGTDTIYYRSGTDTWSPVTIGSNLTFFAGTLNALASTGGVTDGDYGDITVSGLGTVWTIDNNVVTYAKMQDISATQRLIGRNSAGSGDPEEVTLSQALDWATGTAADGNILVRSSGSWTQQPGGAYSVLKDVDAWNERWFCNTNAAGSDPFIGAAISSGTNTTAPSGTALNGTRYGGVLLRQSATANSGYLYQTTATTVRFGTESRLFRAHIFHATALTNRTVRVGFHDSTTSADATDGVYFEIVAGVATGKTSTNSTRSSTGTTHTATVNTWYVYEIEVNAAGTSATFRVLDTSETQLFSATLTTNIPTASGRESAAGIVATANTGGAADICVLGYMAFGTRAGYNRMRTAYAAPSTGTVLRGYIDGYILSPNGSMASDLDIAAGTCADSTNGVYLTRASSITKRLQTSGAWAAGTGANGLDTGAAAANTWYHVWVIADATGATVDVLFSTSATSPTMPSGYTIQRRVGAFRSDGSSLVTAGWVQRGDEFFWNTPQDDVSVLNPGTTAVLRTISTPLGVRTKALLQVGFDATATADNPAAIYISDPAQADGTPSVTINTYVNFSATAHIANTIGQGEVWTDTSRQVRTRVQASATNTRLRVQTRGWRDQRGKDS